jgi:DNA-binding NarL/FixJ family response regulator
MKILVADDHPLYREALRSQLERFFSGTIILEAASFEEVECICQSAVPPLDLTLLDFNMPAMSIDGIRSLVAHFPNTPVAIISGTAQTHDIQAVVEAGARGFIAKTASGTHLEHAIKIIMAGGTSVPADLWFPSKKSKHSGYWKDTLTSRELEVVKRLSRGLTNKEIGRELSLAEITVKLHMRNIFRKMGVRNRAEAAILASKSNAM